MWTLVLLKSEKVKLRHLSKTYLPLRIWPRTKDHQEPRKFWYNARISKQPVDCRYSNSKLQRPLPARKGANKVTRTSPGMKNEAETEDYEIGDIQE